MMPSPDIVELIVTGGFVKDVDVIIIVSTPAQIPIGE